MVSCNKSKIRTCTVTPYSGDKYTIITTKEMTRSEMNAFEDELIMQTTPNGLPASQQTKVNCK